MLHATSRTAKIAGIAALSGLMMAVAIVATVHKPAPASLSPGVVRPDVQQGRLARELDRCATLTMPDSACEAAWAENRRRFFDQPASAAGAADGSTAPNETIAP